MPADRVTRLLAGLWLLLAAMPLWTVAGQHRAFDYRHGWVSAHFATMARAFARQGVMALGGLPLQNNPPLTSEPDFYLHWPPLFPILLAWASRIVGAAERDLHVLMAGVTTVTALMTGGLLLRRFGAVPAFVAAAALLLMPATLRYGFCVIHLHLAILFAVASVGCWERFAADCGLGRASRGWLVAGAVCLGLAVLTSWEPLLLLPGLAGSVAMTPRSDTGRARLGRGLALYGLVALAAAVAVIAFYAWQVPWVGRDLLDRVLLRGGIGGAGAEDFRLHGLDRLGEPTSALGNFAALLQAIFTWGALLGGVGWLGVLLAPVLVLASAPASRFGQARFILLPLLGMWLFWALLMRQHFVVHEYEIGLATPAAAISIGLVVAFLLDWAGETMSPARQKLLRWTCVAILPEALLATAAPYYWEHSETPAAAEVAFGRFIAANTQPGAIVLTPEMSMVPVYYADRHVLRSVTSERLLAGHRAALRGLCSDCPYYVAFAADGLADFPTLAGQAPIAAQGDFALFRFSP